MKSLLIIIVTLAVVYLNYVLIEQLFHPTPENEHDIIPGLIRNPW